VVPSFSGERFGEVAVLTPSGLAATSSTQPFAAALVRAADPARADALYAELAADLELTGQSPPADVRNLLDLGRLPVVLGLFLAVLSGTLLAHSLVLTTRRRAADLAVLRVIGFTPRQVAASLVAMAGTTALVGVLLGLPLGLALGRVVWGEVAGEIGVSGDVALPAVVLVVLPAVVLLVAVVVSLLPARRAALVSPARVLRAE
jgi:putative ABC transport system permease protein